MPSDPPPPISAGRSAPSGAPDVRRAADALVTALRAHLEAVEARTGEADPAVHEAFHALRRAFLAYDEALYDGYDEVLPVEVVEYVEADDDEDHDAL
jgi:hypothetical protein